jgi:PAT family beta-lactamase induction signal transducer AmpG
VTPAALGAGYVVFFLYSTVIGVFAVALAFVVARKQTELQARQTEQTASDATEAQRS